MWDLTLSDFINFGLLPVGNHLGNIFRESDAAAKCHFEFFIDFERDFAGGRGYRFPFQNDFLDLVRLFEIVIFFKTHRK